MSSNTPIISLLFVLLLASSAHLCASQSEVTDSTGYATGSPCPVSRHDGNFCNVKCFRSDPVCGENGKTYWCGCPDAACAGVRAVSNGPCEVGNGGSGRVSGQAFFLIHIVWLLILGFSVFCGFF